MNNLNTNGHTNGQDGAAQLLNLLTAPQQIDLRHYWYVLRRRKWWAIIIILLGTAASVLYAIFFIRPLYEAASTIQVLPSRLLNRSLREVTPGASANVDYRELQKKVLSTDYLLQVVQRLELTRDERAINEAKTLCVKNPALSFDDVLQRVIVQKLRESINLTMLPSSLLFQVATRNEHPETAYQITKTLTDIFIDESKKNELRGIRGVREFSNEQLAIYQQKLDEAEEKLRQFKTRQLSTQARQSSPGVDNLAYLRDMVGSSELAISDRQRRLAQLEPLLPAPATRLLWNDDAGVANIKIQINAKLENFKKNARFSSLQSTYELTFNNDLSLLRQDCQRLLIGVIARRYPQLTADEQQRVLEYQLGQIDLYILRTRAAMANEVINGVADLAAAQPADQLELQRLEDEVAKNRRIYDLFFEQSRGTQIEEALQNSDANFKYLLIEQARVPLTPISGNKTNFVLIGFAVSLGLGLAMILGLEAMDQSIRSVEDVENYLQLPVWGIIPKVRVPFRTWHANLKKLTEMPSRSAAASTPAAPAHAKK